MIAKITAPELARDSASAALQLAGHREYQTEIEARKEPRGWQLIRISYTLPKLMPESDNFFKNHPVLLQESRQNMGSMMPESRQSVPESCFFLMPEPYGEARIMF